MSYKSESTLGHIWNEKFILCVWYTPLKNKHFLSVLKRRHEKKKWLFRSSCVLRHQFSTVEINNIWSMVAQCVWRQYLHYQRHGTSKQNLSALVCCLNHHSFFYGKKKWNYEKRMFFFNLKNRYTGHCQKWVTLIYIFYMYYILDSSSNSGRDIRFYNL